MRRPIVPQLAPTLTPVAPVILGIIRVLRGLWLPCVREVASFRAFIHSAPDGLRCCPVVIGTRKTQTGAGKDRSTLTPHRSSPSCLPAPCLLIYEFLDIKDLLMF